MSYFIEQAQKVVSSISCPVTNRYRATLFKSKDLEELKQLYQSLKQQNQHYECWDCKTNGSDLLHLSRVDAIKKLKSTCSEGVILYLPEEWQCDWDVKHKHTFLSTIAMFSGQMPHVVLLYKDSDQFNAVNTHYFKKYTSLSKDCDVLLPNRAELVTKGF